MKILEYFIRFLQKKFHYDDLETSTITSEQSINTSGCNNEFDENSASNFIPDKVDISKPTLQTRLDELLTQIELYKDWLGDIYQIYLSQITDLKNEFDKDLKESKKELHFKLDPDKSFTAEAKVKSLEEKINETIEGEVKLKICLKRMRRLDCGINKIYNISFWHRGSKEIEKIKSRLECVIQKETEIVREMANNRLIKNNTDIHLLEEVKTTISYCDYLLFKLNMLNSEDSIDEILGKLPILESFSNFNYIESFKLFTMDEICSIKEFFHDIQKSECLNEYKRRCFNIERTFSSEYGLLKSRLEDKKFWKEIFKLESDILVELSRHLQKEKLVIGLTNRIAFQPDEESVYTLPKNIIIQSIEKAYSASWDKRLFVLDCFMKEVSEKITYEEIYIVLLLFDAVEVLNEYLGEEISYMEKYAKKSKYTQEDINLKKQVLSPKNAGKEYIRAFKYEKNKKDISDVLMELKLDFKVDGDIVLLNSFYFTNLRNIYPHNNTNNNSTEEI